MSNVCPTVKVKTDNDDGYKVINESDFDAAVHEKFDAPIPPPPPAPLAPPAAE